MACRLAAGGRPAGGAGGLRADQQAVEFQHAVQRRRLHRELPRQARTVEQARLGRQTQRRRFAPFPLVRGGPHGFHRCDPTVAQGETEDGHRDRVLPAGGQKRRDVDLEPHLAGRRRRHQATVGRLFVGWRPADTGHRALNATVRSRQVQRERQRSGGLGVLPGEGLLDLSQAQVAAEAAGAQGQPGDIRLPDIGDIRPGGEAGGDPAALSQQADLGQATVLEVEDQDWGSSDPLLRAAAKPVTRSNDRQSRVFMVFSPFP
jgi:hypothetical protein